MHDRPAAPAHRKPRRLLALVLLLLALAAGAWWGAQAWQASQQQAELVARGRALFMGESDPPLLGRLRGHDSDLPAAAVRCRNCHVSARDAAAPGEQAFAARLDRALLAQPVARRGGPPSTYSADSLCRTLHEGVDPASVIVAREMPRFPRLTPADCRALWTYFTAELP